MFFLVELLTLFTSPYFFSFSIQHETVQEVQLKNKLIVPIHSAGQFSSFFFPVGRKKRKDEEVPLKRTDLP